MLNLINKKGITSKGKRNKTTFACLGRYLEE